MIGLAIKLGTGALAVIVLGWLAVVILGVLLVGFLMLGECALPD